MTTSPAAPRISVLTKWIVHCRPTVRGPRHMFRSLLRPSPLPISCSAVVLHGMTFDYGRVCSRKRSCPFSRVRDAFNGGGTRHLRLTERALGGYSDDVRPR